MSSLGLELPRLPAVPGMQEIRVFGCAAILLPGTEEDGLGTDGDSDKGGSKSNTGNSLASESIQLVGSWVCLCDGHGGRDVAGGSWIKFGPLPVHPRLVQAAREQGQGNVFVSERLDHDNGEKTYAGVSDSDFDTSIEADADADADAEVEVEAEAEAGTGTGTGTGTGVEGRIEANVTISNQITVAARARSDPGTPDAGDIGGKRPRSRLSDTGDACDSGLFPGHENDSAIQRAKLQ